MTGGTLRFLNATQASSQLLPHYLSLNYDDLFKIQHVRNPFPLRPVSYSSLAAYLECPGCALDQRNKKRPREPRHFTTTHQTGLFSTGEPDPRLLGTLLHTLVNMLHEANGPLAREEQERLLSDADRLHSFIYHDALTTLRNAGKLKLAMFFDQLNCHPALLHRTVVAPLLRYQREIASTDSIIVAGAERFQFKLLSTRKTFAGHPDWGGYVGIVGEFDQIRLRSTLRGVRVPVIVEFKKGLGRPKNPATRAFLVPEEQEPVAGTNTPQPDVFHAMQLMIYWLAFQTRWDIQERVASARNALIDIPMPVQQDLDLVLYNLNDSYQYRLLSSDLSETLQALTECIFHLNWAMKSGYARQSPEHECMKTQLLEVPIQQVQVGYTAISAEECYSLAREAFSLFKKTIEWECMPPPE
ncbi:MAG: PD-(D/E)XK nuclease family protein [Ktedonobacteraceae bacterium]|nr:PD-(D/E)XK nuclease family protein [Ktedonobacteraceae bacterium]